MKDGFAVALSGSNPERTPDSDRGAVGKQVAAVLEVRAEPADTPPRAVATRRRIKRHVSPGFNTPQEPAAKKGMVEDSEDIEKKKPGFDGEAGSARGRQNYSGHTASSQGAWLSIRYAWCDEQGD
jgi:hypothetical protein